MATAVSALAFWLVNGQYRNRTSVIVTLTLGVVLAWIFLWWNSLLVCLLAHYLYNVYVTCRERKIASEDPDYFGGRQPRTIIMDMTKGK